MFRFYNGGVGGPAKYRNQLEQLIWQTDTADNREGVKYFQQLFHKF